MQIHVDKPSCGSKVSASTKRNEGTTDMTRHRPDNRPPEVVWYWFEKEFEKGLDFPSVSWAIGADWGVGVRVLTPEEYKRVAYEHMIAIYGPKP
jgi:hypothetical protein